MINPSPALIYWSRMAVNSAWRETRVISVLVTTKNYTHFSYLAQIKERCLLPAVLSQSAWKIKRNEPVIFSA